MWTTLNKCVEWDTKEYILIIPIAENSKTAKRIYAMRWQESGDSWQGLGAWEERRARDTQAPHFPHPQNFWICFFKVWQQQ